MEGTQSALQALLRLRAQQPGDAAGASRARARRLLSASRLIVVLAVFAMGATLLCAAIGYGVARQSDERLWLAQRSALRNVIAEARLVFGQPGALDPHVMRLVEQSAGLKGLEFEADPAPGARLMQPVVDADGRITGFLTWQRTHPTTDMVTRLMPLIAGIAIVLVGFAGFSLRQLRRAREDLAASEERARRAGDADKLTGLANHGKMLELLDQALAARGASMATTFALIEIDGLADASAELNAPASDDLTATVAQRLQYVLPVEAQCGRIGSNEFALILTAAADFDVEALVRTALDAIARPYWIDSVARLIAYAGIAQAPFHANTRAELTRRAEIALRAAIKRGPGSIVIYEAAIDAISADEKFIQLELPRALAAGELDLHYQPIDAAQGARIVGVEALLRWKHSVRGYIPPATFIPIAEQMGLMDTLGAFVLRRALSEAKRWSSIYVAVTLSPLQMRDAEIVVLVRKSLEDSGVPAARLMLEITEGVLIENPEEMIKRIKDLHALGVRIALDDFGSGYSNLGYLQRFPLDKLKIDKSFVAALGRSPNGGVIIQAIVALGRALGLSVLVEGVETEEQRVLLRLAGCDEMQGYLFAKPAPARTIDRLLAEPARAGGMRRGAEQAGRQTA